MVVSRPKPVRQLCFAMSLKLKGQALNDQGHDELMSLEQV
jgi:hypothetical protein